MLISRYQKTKSKLHKTEDATIPNFIDLTPSVVEYEYGKCSDIFVTLSNITNNTVIIPPKVVTSDKEVILKSYSDSMENALYEIG